MWPKGQRMGKSGGWGGGKSRQCEAWWAAVRTLAVTLGEVGALEGSAQKRDLPGTQGLTGALWQLWGEQTLQAGDRGPRRRDTGSGRK